MIKFLYSEKWPRVNYGRGLKPSQIGRMQKTFKSLIFIALLRNRRLQIRSLKKPPFMYGNEPKKREKRNTFFLVYSEKCKIYVFSYNFFFSFFRLFFCLHLTSESTLRYTKRLFRFSLFLLQFSQSFASP